MEELFRDHSSALSKLTLPTGDTNYDGHVDLRDFSRLKANMGLIVDNLPGDVNFDGVVDLFDLNILKNHLGEGGTDAQAAALDEILLDTLPSLGPRLSWDGVR